MTYQVLARKYRPQTFDEVVGQEAVVATLKNAIAAKRLHHAYLFAGARGIGKTSLARIFAKAVNCEKGPTDKPCNQCNLCREITQGISLDVQEIDGASNTSVEDVRELREQLKYLPASARYKIYIIDEVHMLSSSAFNALLKTLEEPPPHVIFLFATTEVHKIPATILSRCQRFDLRRIPTELLLAKLGEVCQAEKVTVVSDALILIAREAAGSLRDAQSLLDQAIAYTGGALNPERIAEMLGLTDTMSLIMMTEAVLKEESLKALALAQEIYDRGHDLKQLVIQWINHWRNLLVYRVTKSEKSLAGLTETEMREVIRQSGLAEPAVLDMGFHLLHRGVEEIARSEFPKLLLDILVVRLSNASQLQGLGEILEQLKSGGGAVLSSSEGSSPRGASVSEVPQTAAPKEETPASLHVPRKGDLPSRLQDFIQKVSGKRPQVGSLLHHVKASALVGDTLYFQMERGSIWMDLLNERKDQLEELAREFYGRSLRAIIQDSPVPEGGESLGGQVSVRENTNLDPMVKTAMNILNAVPITLPVKQPHSGGEGEAPAALPMEGATRAPTIEEVSS